MNEHTVSKISVCLPDNRKLYCVGVVIRIWTVAPAWDRNLGFTAYAWTVRSLETGIRFATFKDLSVALRFAEYLWRNYGDITQALVNNYNYAETPADAAILDEINVKANHVSKLITGDPIRRVAIKSDWWKAVTQ